MDWTLTILETIKYVYHKNQRAKIGLIPSDQEFHGETYLRVTQRDGAFNKIRWLFKFNEK